MTGMFDSETSPGGGDVLYPAQCLGHLLMVWTVGYIDHAPTIYSVPGKKSDVIVVDVVDLDAADEDGYQGRLYRQAWWRNNRLIGFLKQKIGRPHPVLAIMVQGAVTMGNKPYELQLMDSDPGSVDRGAAWMASHPDFRATVPLGQNPEAERVPAQAPQERRKSQLESFAERQIQRDPHQQALRDAAASARPTLPPARPVSPVEEPPF